MAPDGTSLALVPARMRNREPSDLRCSYVVLVERPAAEVEELRNLATYLSALRTEGCEVIILDASPRAQLELNRRVLRWVGRHVILDSDYRNSAGRVDLVRAAAGFASCEKIVVASEDIRYDPEAIVQMCRLLELHDVIEPQDYLDPLPWWAGIETARILVDRGLEPRPGHVGTFALRRSALAKLPGLDTALAGQVQSRRLTEAGAEVFTASRIFVRREPRPVREWLTERPRIAAEDFAVPMKTMFFLSFAPFLALLAILGGSRLAAGYVGAVSVASIALALRGRMGAHQFFPLRTALFAPLWILERSISVYWAIYRNLRGLDRVPAAGGVAEASRHEKAASGE